MINEKSLSDHFCVNPNTCDICRGVLPAQTEGGKGEIKNNSPKKRSEKGPYFVPHTTWQI